MYVCMLLERVVEPDLDTVVMDRDSMINLIPMEGEQPL